MTVAMQECAHHTITRKQRAGKNSLLTSIQEQYTAVVEYIGVAGRWAAARAAAAAAKEKKNNEQCYDTAAVKSGAIMQAGYYKLL